MSRASSIHPMREAIVVTLLMVLVAATAVYAGFSWDYRVQMETVKSELRRLASVGAEQVDAELHKQLSSPDQMGKEVHQRVLKPLVRMHKAVPEIMYLYTAVKGKDAHHLILDTTTESAELNLKRPVKPSPIMEVYEHVTPAMLEALEKGTVSATTELYTDKFGTFLSAYAPFRDSTGAIAGVVGVDMDIQTFMERLEAARNAWAISAFSLMLAALAVGWSVYLMRRDTQRHG